MDRSIAMKLEAQGDNQVVVANAIGAFVFVTGRRKTSGAEVFQNMQEET